MRLCGIDGYKIRSNFRVAALRVRLGRRVEIGFDSRIGPKCKVLVLKGSKVRLRGANLSRAVTLETGSNALLEIGNSFIGLGSIISAQQHVRIGDGSMLAEYVTIRDHNHVQSPEVPLSAWHYTTSPVCIGDDVWIAAKATVVAGVSIADHALCAAGAVVTRNVEPWQRVGGVPARPLKQ